MNIDISEPKKLALFLAVTLAQRNRARTQASAMYGNESAAVSEIDQDIVLIREFINAGVKASAAAPMKK